MLERHIGKSQQARMATDTSTWGSRDQRLPLNACSTCAVQATRPTVCTLQHVLHSTEGSLSLSLSLLWEWGAASLESAEKGGQRARGAKPSVQKVG